MGHPEVENDFRGSGAEISAKELNEYFEEKKYKLGMYHNTTGRERYGVIPASADGGVTQEVGLTPREIDLDSSAARIQICEWMRESRDVYRRDLLLLLLGTLVATIAHFRDVNNSRLTKFFKGRSVGRRLLFAVLCCLASSNGPILKEVRTINGPRARRKLLKHFLSESRTLLPYIRLNQPDAHPRPTILLRKRTLPLTSLLPMLHNRHFTAATIAFTALLSEFLVVALSGLPYRPGQLREEFLFCAIASLRVLSIMLAELGGLDIWRRFLPHLPRKPDSVAAAMTYVCDSKMNVGLGAGFCQPASQEHLAAGKKISIWPAAKNGRR
ncbi:hypothetical protein FGG08_004946 [Glutinoglossum americanum]|uniref:Uncharacterized protein n=1 Tax=Glutinoglossum americanum TaxID=1670608 RepID=A0A9P8I6E9_9PEZI|nr:hypothetical protein FGG08_004946 [Glutinoglossum americanum]